MNHERIDISQFYKAITMEPSEKKFYNIALEYYIQGKYKKAIEFSKKALKVKTSYLDAHLLLANTYSKLGKNDKTELYLTNALKIEPNNTNVIRGLIYFYYHKKRYRDCMQALERYLSLKPEDYKIQLLKFNVLLSLGYYKKAYYLISQITPKYEVFTKFIKIVSEKKVKDSFFRDMEIKIEAKTEEFHEKVKNYQEYPDEFPMPSMEESLEISFLYLFNGDSKNAMKYLIYAKKLQEERDF